MKEFAVELISRNKSTICMVVQFDLLPVGSMKHPFYELIDRLRKKHWKEYWPPSETTWFFEKRNCQCELNWYSGTVRFYKTNI